MTSIAVVAANQDTRDRLAAIVPPAYEVVCCGPNELPSPLPELFVLALPSLHTPEEQLIERLRADDTTTQIPIVLASALPMMELQSVPYASDWTIAIVEEPVSAAVLAETMQFLLGQ